MPFRPKPVFPDFSRLKSALVGARDQIKDYLIFQTISQLLDLNQRSQTIFIDDLEGVEAAIEAIQNAAVATVADETLVFPNSRQLLAGAGITFDDSVDNERTINSDGGIDIGYWSPLVTSLEPGDAEFVLTDDRNTIAVFTFTP